MDTLPDNTVTDPTHMAILLVAEKQLREEGLADPIPRHDILARAAVIRAAAQPVRHPL